jgi:hypothetical protein
MSISMSQKESLGSIFNGNAFVIPTYQRKYSWTDVERRALWTDIDESLRNDLNHFLGTLSFKQNETEGLSTDTVYEVIDGQQRLTTIFILLSVLIDALPDATVGAAQRIAFIGSAGNLRLRPLGSDGTFLSRVLFQYEDISADTIVKRSELFLYQAKREFKSFVAGLNASDVERWIKFIRDRIEVLVFNVSSQAQAVKMFSIINDRGLPLRILDKTKSILMLYSTLHLNEELNDFINARFEDIFDSYDDLLISRDTLGILGRLDENTVFTHHYFSSRRFFPDSWNNRNSAETIFGNLKQRCQNLKDDDVRLRSFIQDYLDDLASFSVGYSTLIQEAGADNILKKLFVRLEFTGTLYPLIVRLYLQGKLIELLDILETVEVRVYKTRGTNPIADAYWLSSDIAESDLSADEIRERLKFVVEKFMSDHVFRNYLDADIYGNGALKYILSEYDGGTFSIEDFRDFQVEHIFSKDPQFDVAEFGFEDEYDYEKNRLGNLTLLEGRLNGRIGNVAPPNKVSGYLESSFEMTRNLAGRIQSSGLRKEDVDARREELITYCLDRFRIR